MAAKDVKFLANLGLHGSLRFLESNADFPTSPSIGDVLLKGTELFAYVKIGDFETWYPFANKTNAYIHTQGVSSSLWTVTHNLGTTDIWTQIRDSDNNIVYANLQNITPNSFQIQFTEALLGSVIVVAPDSLDVPSVTTSSITVGNVEITGSNITINGNQVLTAGGTGSFATIATTGSFNDLLDKPTTLSGYGITDAQAKDADLTAIAALNGTGFAKRTGVDTWTLDNSNYITGNQNITVSGDASGSGTTSINLTLANSGVSAGDYTKVTVDAKGRVISGTNPTTLSGYGIIDATPASHIGSGGSAHAPATGSTSGFMSAADKSKLDGIEVGANNYILPVADTSTLGGVKDGAGVTISGDGTISANVISVAGKTGSVTLDKVDVGLDNVENKSSATIRSELTLLNVTNALSYTPENIANKNAVNGYAGLDASGKISSSQLPAIAITDTFVVASQSAMLALSAETGDVAVRTDINKSFILKGSNASSLADWQELLTPTDSVLSVNGMTGAVTISSITGNASTATTLQTARNINDVPFDGSSNITISRVRAVDNRIAAPEDFTPRYATVGFGSWNNNNTTPYADYITFRTYTDSSGGNDNMVSFRKDAIGMRIWQQTYGSATDFATYKDVAFTDSNITGSAATLTTARTIWGQSFNGSANVTGSLTSVGNITGAGAVTLTATAGTLALAATGANVITASTNGSERIRIDSSGNVGIGTTSPQQDLHVQSASTTEANVRVSGNAGATGYLDVYHNATNAGFWLTNTQSMLFGTNSTERMRITSGGLIGIGLDSPDSTLHVRTDSATTNSPIQVLNVQSTTSGTAANGIGARIALTTERVTGAATTAAYIDGILTDATNISSALAFSTRSGGGGLNERMRITDLGRVLIGTSSDDGTNRVQISGSLAVGDSNVTNAGILISRFASSITAKMHTYIASANSPWYHQLFGGQWTGERQGTTDASNAYYIASAPAAVQFEIGRITTTGAFTDVNMSPAIVVKGVNNNVLIGTTTDSSNNAKLQIRGSDSVTSIGGQSTLALLGGDTDGDFCNLRFATSLDGPIVSLGAKATTTGAYPSTVGELHVGVQNGASTNTVAIFKGSNGNVLIGTTTDNNRKLQVYGSGLFTDASGIQSTIWSEAVSGAGGIGTNSNHPFVIMTNGVERVRVFASGNINVTGAVAINNISLQNTATLTTTSTTPNQVVTTFQASAYRSAKFQVQVTSGTSYHVTEIMVMHDGTTTYINEYGIMFTGSSLATFDADISSGNVRLLVTPTNAATTIKVAMTLIAV